MTIPLNAKAILDNSDFKSKLDELASSTKAASSSMKSFFSELGLSSVMQFVTITGAIAGTVDILKECTQEAAEDEALMARLTVTMKNLGRGGEEAAAGLEEEAMQLQAISGINHDDILRAYNAIAKFENIKTGDMDRLVKDAMEMSVAMGGDLADNAESIARVLETGVIPRTWGFSIALKEQIADEVKAGDSTKALDDTLGMLEKRFGGQIQASMDTAAGKLRLVNAEIKTMEEEIGQKTLPIWKTWLESIDLFLTMGDKMDAALKGHADGVLKSSKSYKEYSAEIDRANKAARAMSETEWELMGRTGTKEIEKMTEAQYRYAQIMSFATKEVENFGVAYDQYGLPKINAFKAALVDADQAIIDYAGDLADAEGVVKDNTQYTKDLADAYQQLSDDTAAGWGKNSQKIKDDQKAIKDLEDAHHKAMLQMQVDLLQYGLTLDGTFDEADQQRILDYELKLGLLTQAEYDEATAIIARKAALDKLPKEWSAEYKTYWMTYYLTYGEEPPSGPPTNPNPLGGGTGEEEKHRRSDYPPGPQGDAEWWAWLAGGGKTYQAGTPGWVDVPSGHPTDTYPVLVNSNEEFNVRQKGESSGGEGMILNNYGTIVFPENRREDKAELLRQLR